MIDKMFNRIFFWLGLVFFIALTTLSTAFAVHAVSFFSLSIIGFVIERQKT